MRNYQKVRAVPAPWKDSARPTTRNNAQFQYTTEAAAVPALWEYEEPTRAASVVSDVWVPLLQSAISGVFVAVAVGAAGGVVVHLQSWPVWYAVVSGAAAGFLAASVSWARLLADTRALLRNLETWSGRDLDGDGVVGEPVLVQVLKLEVQHSGTRNGLDFLTVPVDQGVFLTWARAALAGRSLAVGQWVGRGRPFSRGEYDALLSELERAQIVRLIDPKNVNQGRELTKPGAAALRACMRAYATVPENMPARAAGWGGAA